MENGLVNLAVIVAFLIVSIATIPAILLLGRPKRKSE